MTTNYKKFFNWKTILFVAFILFGTVSLVSRIYDGFQQESLLENMNENLSGNWNVFTSAANHFQVSFPDKVEEIGSGDTTQYVSKDSLGNLFIAQRFIPDTETTRGQSSKDMLRTAIKVLVMKDNVKLDDTTYSEYLGETVAVDFSGQVSSRPFKGKIILENNSFYYLYSILKSKSQENLANYDKFIKSFQLTNG